MLNLLNLLRLVMANKKQQSVKSGTKVLPHSKVMLMTDGN